MQKWFAIPYFEDEYRTFTYQVLQYTLLLLLGLVAAALFFASRGVQSIFTIAAMLVFITSYALLRHSHQDAAGMLFLAGLWSIITVASFSLNGIRNASVTTYVLVIIFAAILFSDRAVMLFMGLSILSVIVMVWGEVQGVLPLRTTPLFLADRFFQQIAIFGSAGVLLIATSRVIRRSIERTRQNEQALIAQNKILAQEIEERERAEATLRISEEKYRLLFESINVMCVVYNWAGRVVLGNPAAAVHFHLDLADLPGKTPADLLPPDAAQVLNEQLARVYASGIPEKVEQAYIGADGTEFHFMRHLLRIPRADGEMSEEVLVMTTDLTEQKKAARRQRELEVAQEKNAFLTDFLGTVSHDLKTPLSVMNTSLYLLQRSSDPARRQQKLDQLREQISVLDRYIQDMLTISRLEHLPEFNREIVEMQPLVREVLETLRPRSERKDIQCEYKVEAGSPTILADREQLRRVLVNLVENAINYTPPRGKVRVSVREDVGQILVEVEDTGIGIPDKDIPHIFERFYRAEEARKVEISGTGLGLAIVKKIIDMHEGEIEVISQPGQGTSFRLWLPVPLATP